MSRIWDILLRIFFFFCLCLCCDFRVVLQFVHEMQYRAQKNYDASKDKSLSVFGVGVAFIDETSIHSFTSQETEKAIEDIRSIVSKLAPPSKELYVVPIENVFSSDGVYGKERLKNLLDAVSDDTGKEDLIIHLRMLSLQKVPVRLALNFMFETVNMWKKRYEELLFLCRLLLKMGTLELC